MLYNVIRISDGVKVEDCIPYCLAEHYEHMQDESGNPLYKVVLHY